MRVFYLCLLVSALFLPGAEWIGASRSGDTLAPQAAPAACGVPEGTGIQAEDLFQDLPAERILLRDLRVV